MLIEDNPVIKYVIAVFERTTEFLEVVTPQSIYHDLPTQKTFWEEKFTPVNMRSCERRNVRKHKETKNGNQYIDLNIS